MKNYSTLKVTTMAMLICFLLTTTPSHASPSNRWDDDNGIDGNLVQQFAKRLLDQMTEFERIRRTGLSARQGALSHYLKAKALSARIHNPFGPGKRK